MNDILKINPEVMVWARDTAELSIENAAYAIGLPVTHLGAIERGDMAPSRYQLSNMARSYKRPIFALYLTNPPQGTALLEDFRTTVSARNLDHCQDLEVLIRDLQVRHALLKSVLQGSQKRTRLNFIASASMSEGASALSRSIENRLGLSKKEIREAATQAAGFELMRQKIEGLGIFVMLSGHISWLHAILPARIYRSFTLIDPTAPLISINENVDMSDWIFTLIHELAHLWLGESGVTSLRLDDACEQRLEQFCEDVASEFLLPMSDLESLGLTGLGTIEQRDRIIVAARAWQVSQQLLAYRVYQAGLLSKVDWCQLNMAIDELWRVNHRQNKTVAHENLGATTENEVRRQRLGPRLLKLTREALASRQFTRKQASQVLALQARKIPDFLTIATPEMAPGSHSTHDLGQDAGQDAGQDGPFFTSTLKRNSFF